VKPEDLYISLNAISLALRLAASAVKPFEADIDALETGSEAAASVAYIKTICLTPRSLLQTRRGRLVALSNRAGVVNPVITRDSDGAFCLTRIGAVPTGRRKGPADDFDMVAPIIGVPGARCQRPHPREAQQNVSVAGGCLASIPHTRTDPPIQVLTSGTPPSFLP
jgi:hypothetical protein